MPISNKLEREYTCEACNETFVEGWHDEDARAEAIANGFNPDDCAMVCYYKIMASHENSTAHERHTLAKLLMQEAYRNK
jgi:hypothetical protein